MANESKTAPPGKELSSLEAEKRELEREIEQHSNWIINKKRRLNALSTVGRLPPEILTEIFLFAASSWTFPITVPPVRRTHPYRWIGITHVCHYWRDAALFSPRLWGDISVRCSMECLREVLARSKQAPLLVTANFGHPAGTQLVLDELRRITRLDLPIHARVTQQPVIPESAPHLKSLLLRFHEPSIDTPRLTTPFDKCDMPRLAELELYGNELTWRSPIFKPTLTSLSVSCNGGQIHSSLDELLNVLETMPQLRSLQLRHALPPSPPGFPSVTRQVSLNQLQSLSLSGRTRQCVWVWQHLSYPIAASTCIDGVGTTNCDVQRLSQTMVKKLQDAAPAGQQIPPITKASILNEDDRWDPQFQAWTALHSQTTFAPDGSVLPAQPLLNVTFREDYDFLLFALFHSGLSLTEVDTLLITPTRFVPPSKANWRLMCEGMPNLRELTVGRIAQDSIVDTLSLRVPKAEAPSDKPAKRRRMQPVFPHLQKLVFQHIPFRPSYLDMLDDHRPTQYRRMLAARQRSRCMLGELVLDGCANLCAEDVDKLRTLVGEVRWDPASARNEVPESDYSDEEYLSDFDEDFDDAYEPLLFPFFPY